jgi:hypothetical protein
VSVRNYAVVSLDELERYPAMSGAPVLMPLRRRLDVRAFGSDDLAVLAARAHWLSVRR